MPGLPASADVLLWLAMQSPLAILAYGIAIGATTFAVAVLVLSPPKRGR